MRAGLIPSRALQEGRIIHERQIDPQTLDGEWSKAIFLLYFSFSNKLDKQSD